MSKKKCMCAACVSQREKALRRYHNNKEQLKAYQKEYARRNKDNPRFRVNQLVGNAAARARNKNLPFELDTDTVLARLEEIGNKCQATGIALDLAGAGTPWSLSLDQIIPGEGYTLENTRLVCAMFNYAKNKWTDEDVTAFCRGYLEHS